MLNFKLKSKTTIYLVLLFLVMVITRLEWFNPFSLLYSGDWQYRHHDFVVDNWKSWLTWTSFDNVGGYNVQLYNYPIRGIIWSAVTRMGFSYDLAVKISILWPLSIVSFFGTFLLGKRIFKNNLFAFTSTLFYNSTTYFLIMQTRHLFIAIIYAFLPFYIYLFDRCLKQNRVLDWLIFSVFFSIGIFYELRMMFITVFVLALYFFIKFEYKKWSEGKAYYMAFLKNLVISFFTVLFINLFWILPLLLIADNNLEDTAGRPLFGNHLFTMKQALTIFRWSWTGGFEDRSFVIQPISPYLFIPPLIAFLGILITAFRLKAEDFKNKKFFIFGTIITLIGIFLTKQSDRPLVWFYSWAYQNIPGFEVFREASKFYTITATGYFFLIGLTLVSINGAFKNKILLYFTVFSVLLTSFLNFSPFITQEIDSLFVSREVPNDYYVLADYIKSQEGDFKIGWIPHSMVYGYYSWNNPRHTFLYFPKNGWDHLDHSDISHLETKDSILDIISKPYSRNFFDNLNIKYIVLPTRVKENYNDVFPGRGGEIDDEELDIYKYYQQRMDEIEYLTRVDLEGVEDFTLYRNESHRPQISRFDNLFVTGKNINDTFELVDSEVELFSYLNSQDYDKNQDYFSFAETFSNDFDVKKLLEEGVIKYDYKANDKKETFIDYENNLFEVFGYLDQEREEVVLEISPLKNLYLDGKESFVITNLERVVIPVKDFSQKNIFIKKRGNNFQQINTEKNFLAYLNKEQEFEIVSLYRNQNLINNPNFKEGAWNEKVKNCHNYDGKPDIKMNLINKGNFRNVLELVSNRHIACTDQRILLPEIEEGEQNRFLLEYDFYTDKSESSSQINFFSDGKSLTFSRKPREINNWNRYSNIVDLEKISGSTLLTVYATPEKSRVLYDNFSLQKINSEKKVSMKELVTMENIKERFDVPDDIQTIEANLEQYNITNLIKNPGFENGFWNDEVKNCHRHDDNPDIEMNLAPGNNSQYSLELISRRHVACSDQNIEIKHLENTKYLLEFDFSFKNADAVRIRYTYNDPENTFVVRNVYQESRKKLEPESWHTYREFLDIPEGATNLNLRLESVTYTNPRADEVITRFDNFTLLAIPDIGNNYKILSQPKKPFSPAKVDFNFINSTEYEVNLKNVDLSEEYSGKIALHLSQRFNEGWQLKNKTNSDGFFWTRFLFDYKDLNNFQLKHLKSISNTNIWLIDVQDFCSKNSNNCNFNQDGTVDLNFAIIFSGEKYFRGTFLFSAGFFLFILSLVLYIAKNEFIRQSFRQKMLNFYHKQKNILKQTQDSLKRNINKNKINSQKEANQTKKKSSSSKYLVKSEFF